MQFGRQKFKSNSLLRNAAEGEERHESTKSSCPWFLSGSKYLQCKRQILSCLLTDEQDLYNINKTLDLLDEDEDVQEVYHNWDE